MPEGAASLVGHLLLRPGMASPGSLVSTRPDLVARLAHGRLASELPALLASLFNLCGSAHRLCAERAVQAARREAAPHDPEAAERLRRDTLREHLRRMGLDWPRQLAGMAEQPQMAAAALQALRTGPVPAAAEARAGIAAWLARDWLCMPAEDWLQAWERGPRQGLEQWSSQADAWLPRLLHGVRALADRATPGAQALRVHAHPQTLWELAEALRHSAFARQPQWRGRCAETGPWTRLHDPGAAGQATPWLRLGARVAEAVRLALPDAPARTGTGWLQSGQLALPGLTGVGWVEMARGLLVHCVTLDGEGPQARVLRCSVVAPTDWNFHPHGAVAQALAQLPCKTGAPETRRILALMSAYDPCVPFVIEPELCDA